MSLNADTLHPTLREAKEIIRKSVVGFPFNNFAVLLSFLDHAQTLGTSAREAFSTWTPDSISMITENGGTNCVGATQVVNEKLRSLDIAVRTIRFIFNFTLYGLSSDDVPFSHCALIISNNEEWHLADPGLGIPELVPMNTENMQVADHAYTTTFDGNNGKLIVQKPNGKNIIYDFEVAPEGWNPDQEIQKPLLTSTTRFKIDSFTPDGKKKASAQIDFWQEEINFILPDKSVRLSFQEFITQIHSGNGLNPQILMMVSDVSQKLGKSEKELINQIETMVQRKKYLHSIWNEKIQRAFYLQKPHELSPWETSWNDLQNEGYIGGGVVLIPVNERGEVLLYEVPSTREKPKLGRYAGQWNLFVETAEKIAGADGQEDTWENFSDNLRRAITEELGAEMLEKTELVPDFYREIDYRPAEVQQKIRARCAVVKIPSDSSDHINEYHTKNNSQELGTTRWITIDKLLTENLEPNARKILQAMIHDGYLQSASRDAKKPGSHRQLTDYLTSRKNETR